MKLLAIETATEACSAALWVDGTMRVELEIRPRGQSELILGMMDRLLANAGLRPGGLDALAFGCGPGSFTGVRIAAAVIQGVAFAADLPVVPVSTLAALAQGLHRTDGAQRILPAYDARMGELYWGVYEIGPGGLVVARAADRVATPDRVVPGAGGGWVGVGSGWAAHGVQLADRLGDRLASWVGERACSAEDVATLALPRFARGELVTAEEALPVYLRDRVAQLPGS